jgi:hypothetical protein
MNIILPTNKGIIIYKSDIVPSVGHDIEIVDNGIYNVYNVTHHVNARFELDHVTVGVMQVR